MGPERPQFGNRVARPHFDSSDSCRDANILHHYRHLDHIATSHRHRGLVALSAYLQAIPDGDGIRTDLKRDLEQRLTEVTTEWIKDQKVEETIEKLDEFVVRVSMERRNSEIDPEWADRLIETAQQALALLTTGDTGND